MRNTAVPHISSPNLLLLVILIAVILIVIPFRALKTRVTDRERRNPPKKRDACKETPRKCLPFRPHSCRQSEEAAGQKRPDAAAGCREGLSKAVERAQSLVRGCRVCDLRPVVSNLLARGQRDARTHQKHDAAETTNGTNVLEN